MSTAPALLSSTDKGSTNGIAFVSGKITAKRKFNTQRGWLFEVVMKLPSADEFSSPATINVTSEEDPGTVGDTVKLKVRISGSPYQAKRIDKDTGEVSKYASAIVRLNVVS